MQQGSPKSSHESKAAFKSNQKPAIIEFARISKSQVFPSLIAVGCKPCLQYHRAATGGLGAFAFKAASDKPVAQVA
jgi:hypothetical protein